MSNIWEEIHLTREWGRYPNEELVRFIGKNFFQIPKNLRKNIKILELGTGQGANVWFLMRENFDVYGIDISSSALKKMEKRLKEEGFYLSANEFKKKFKVGDIRKIPFDNSFFDVVLDIATVYCVKFSEHEKVYQEIYRVLKKGGFFFSFHLLKNSWGFDESNLIDKDTVKNVKEGPLSGLGIQHFADYDDLITLLKDNGFQIIESEMLTRTYQNRTKKINWAIIVAKKR